jgi:hypothetical protein
MCKEMPVILVNKVVDLKSIIGKKWRAKEERHKGSLTPKKYILDRKAILVMAHCFRHLNNCLISCYSSHIRFFVHFLSKIYFKIINNIGPPGPMF